MSDTKDLVQRLRRYGQQLAICNEAADTIERLTVALKKANGQTEHFEREWYLRGDEIERLTAELERIDLKAQAGLCYFGLESARAFLQDIRDIVAARTGSKT